MSADLTLAVRAGGLRFERVELSEDLLPEIIGLCRRTLGWKDGHPDEAFFRWKHLENPFGVSPAWMARDGDRLVGLRVLMRWRFVQFGRPVDVVRAVDTATDPDYQGRGIFATLTSAAIAELEAEGTQAVFNTPNAKSLPGYRKLGWRELGRAPIVGLPLRPVRAALAARRRDPAERWAEAPTVGVAVADALRGIDAGPPVSDGRLRTDRSPAYLRWRYGFGPLGYGAVTVDDDPQAGVLIFRVRRRGDVHELSLCEALVPEGGGRRAGLAVVRLARRAGADMVIAGAADRASVLGLVPLPNVGPVFTWRPLASAITPSLGALALSLGDLELF